MARRLLVVLLALLVLVPAACTWDRTEPGLFRTRPPAAPTPQPSGGGPERTNPALPVAGEAVWTTGDGSEITVRIAVHAVRRTVGATVLDWSVTPLTSPGAELGDRLIGTADLGLTDESASSVAINLVDATTRKAYRPLRHADRRLFNHCLCTPVWRVQQSLQLGETDLMQVAYPPLPTGTEFIDVAFATVAPFFHVPVTPVGLVPTARQPTDLARPPGERRTVSTRVHFRYSGPPARQLSIQVHRVVASAGFTAVEWSIQSRGDQTRSSVDPYGPTVSGTIPAEVNVVNANPTNGPTVRPTRSQGAALRANWMTADIFGRAGYQCLCTELGLWAQSLWFDNGSARVMTTYPALPAGTRRVDVALPGVSTLTDLPVEPAADAAAALGPAAVQEVDVWTYPDEDPPQGWRTSLWPTPVPDPWQLPNYDSRVESIGPLPRT